MKISYKPLWHSLVEKKMNKEELKKISGISSNIVARMGRDESVNLETIVKICTALDCKIQDVVEISKE